MWVSYVPWVVSHASWKLELDLPPSLLELACPPNPHKGCDAWQGGVKGCYAWQRELDLPPSLHIGSVHQKSSTKNLRFTWCHSMRSKTAVLDGSTGSGQAFIMSAAAASLNGNQFV